MGLENLSRQLVVDAKKEADAIIAHAKSDAQKIIEAAQVQRKQIIADAKKKAAELSDREKSEKTSSANLEAKKIIDEQKNQVVQKALLEVFAHMQSFNQSKEYPQLLKKLIAEGEKELGKDCVVKVNEQDQKIAKKFFSNISKEPAGISGGAIIETKDGRVRIDNSFEALFEQQKENIKQEIFAEIFLEKKK